MREKENNPNYENLTKKQKRNFKKKMRKKMKKAAQKIGTTNTESFLEDVNEDDDEESSVTSGKIDEKEIDIDEQASAEIGEVEIVNPEKSSEQQSVTDQKTNEAPIGQRKLADLDQDLKVTIADLGNACWTHNHFTSEIQTRQ